MGFLKRNSKFLFTTQQRRGLHHDGVCLRSGAEVYIAVYLKGWKKILCVFMQRRRDLHYSIECHAMAYQEGC